MSEASPYHRSGPLPEGLPSPDQWRERLIAIYESRGFRIEGLLPKLPIRPTKRIPKPRHDYYDYKSEELPYSPEDEQLAAEHWRQMNELRAQYGKDNVVTAHMTDEMIAAHPDLAGTHIVAMVREVQAEQAA